MDNQRVSQLLEAAYENMLKAMEVMGYPIGEDPNFRGTTHRAKEAFLELVQSPGKVESEAQCLLSGGVPAGQAQGMVLCKDIVAYGLCPHHLLPVTYKIALAYLPGPTIIGLSKLARLARLFAGQPILQETLTRHLAQNLCDGIQAKGAAALVQGFHLCMAARGIKESEGKVITSSFCGQFESSSSQKREFITLSTNSV